MKFKIFLCLFCIIFTLPFGGVYADSVEKDEYDEYIVYLKKSDISTYSINENPGYIIVSKNELRTLLQYDFVEFYEPNYEIELFEDFHQTPHTEQWNLENINVSKAWQIGCFGNDVKIAVIDSGIYAHPDLKSNLLDGHNYLTNTSDTTDNIGHGTFVTGIISAEANGQYIDGIAPHAKIIPLKCFDNGYATKVSTIVDAIYGAVDVYGCDVINMSFGITEIYASQALKTSIEYALRNNCILVASVGNDGNDTIYYPANYDGVIGVGAVDENNVACSFSQKNSTVDVVAPGQGIPGISTADFKENSGTSFSAPHVTAMAAIAKCIDTDITPREFQNILSSTSIQLGETEYNTTFGYGLINIENMINKLLENTAVFISPILTQNNHSTVTVYNNGAQTFNAYGITAAYDKNRLCGFEKKDISILPKETDTLEYNQTSNLKFMLWNNFNNLMPLAKYRESSDSNTSVPSD